MNSQIRQQVTAAERALAERARKGHDIESGEANAHAVKARKRKKVVTRSSADVEPEARDAMIAEAAYFRSAHRGFEPGHEVDDWLAAESDIDLAIARDACS